MGVAKQAEIHALLKIYNNGTLTQFLHECIDNLVRNTEINHENHTTDLERTVDVQKAVHLIQNLYTEWTTNPDPAFTCPDFPQPMQEAVIECHRTRKKELFQALTKRSCLASGTKNLVETFDYKLKWVLGSSKLSALREALLRLDLYCVENRDGDGDVRRSVVNFEADLGFVDRLIVELERANAEIKSNLS